MNRIEQAAYFGAMMGKVAAGQGLGAGQSNQEADNIINSFMDSEKPVDPKALMAGRGIPQYGPTFQANRPARPQLSNKDISGMQGAFGNQASFAQKTSPVVKNPMLSQPPAGPSGRFSNAQIDPANQNPGNYPHNAPTAHPGPRPSMR